MKPAGSVWAGLENQLLAQCVVNPYMANASAEPSGRYYKRLRRGY